MTGARQSTTDTDPVSIIVDPGLGRYIYTANYLGNSVSGFKLNPSDGTIEPTQATPYPTGANPRALIAVPHGNHALVNSSVIASRGLLVASADPPNIKKPNLEAGLFVFIKGAEDVSSADNRVFICQRGLLR